MTRLRSQQPRRAKPVAVVTTTIPITVDGFYREVIRQIQARGYDVCVVSSPGPMLDIISRDMNVRVRQVPMIRGISPFSDLIAMFAWLRICSTERPSLIFSATPKASLLSQLAGKATRVERRLYCMVGLRLEGERGGKRQLLAAMEKITSWASTEVVANSPSLAARYAALRLAPKRKLRQTLSDHGVDSDHFRPRASSPELAHRLGLDTSVPVIGLVGRLTHDKGIDTLINAMGLLEAGGIPCQLLVVGAQNEPDSTAYLAKFASMGNGVVAVDAVEDVRPYFALMNVHVLPSLREGFPNVVLEASAMGLASVTTDATGAIDSVKHGETGLIVSANDSLGLANAIKSLLLDSPSATQYGLAARAWAVADFQPEEVVRILLAFERVHETLAPSDSDADSYSKEQQ